MMKQIQVRHVFPVRERQHLLVQLESFNWDFVLGLSVELVAGDLRIRARQVGSGNHQGVAVVELLPEGVWEEVELCVSKMLNSGSAVALRF